MFLQYLFRQNQQLLYLDQQQQPTYLNGTYLDLGRD